MTQSFKEKVRLGHNRGKKKKKEHKKCRLSPWTILWDLILLRRLCHSFSRTQLLTNTSFTHSLTPLFTHPSVHGKNESNWHPFLIYMTFNDDNNNYKLHNLRIIYNLQQSPISKSCPLFFYDAHSLHSIYYPTHWLMLFSSVESQGLQFSILCAHHCWEQLCPVDTFSRFFPALSLQCFLPSLQVSEPTLQPGLPEEAKATPLPACPLLQLLLDSNLLG